MNIPAMEQPVQHANDGVFFQHPLASRMMDDETQVVWSLMQGSALAELD
jgi:hypothetical protein